VLDGIEVDVVDVALQVGIIANGMLPIATLPNSALAPADLARTARSIAGKSAGKSSLDQAPAQRKIRIAFRQRPNRMQVIRQNSDCDSLERITPLYGRIDAPEPVDVPHKGVT
jgi:hypothetical protein